MKIEFKYSLVQDLMYHILAHIKVENASNLYSREYIDNINEAKNGRCVNIRDAVNFFSNYYNENFERLAIINFLPLFCSSVQELIAVIENYYAFTQEDKESFIFPLNQLLKSECVFYEEYWNKLYNTTAMDRKAIEEWIKNEMSKYEALFTYFNKFAVIGFSYSLTNNGRGYGGEASFNAVVPFVFNESEYKNLFYQILHEYTHQFTDEILCENIRMDDGTHDISEKAVILFDYYLIKKLHKEDTASYFKWISSATNVDNCDEKLFLSVFKIRDDINEKLLELVDKIIM